MNPVKLFVMLVVPPPPPMSGAAPLNPTILSFGFIFTSGPPLLHTKSSADVEFLPPPLDSSPLFFVKILITNLG